MSFFVSAPCRRELCSPADHFAAAIHAWGVEGAAPYKRHFRFRSISALCPNLFYLSPYRTLLFVIHSHKRMDNKKAPP